MNNLITFRSTSEQARALKVAAEATGMTVADYLRRAVEMQMREDCKEAEEAVQCTHIVLAAAHDAGRDAEAEQRQYAAANMRWAILSAAIEGFRHG